MQNLSNQEAKIAAVASNIRVDAAAAEVVRALDAAGVQSLLLKGASLARWLHVDGEPWSYMDCDLLVSPRDLATAERVLAELGFMQHFDERDMPDWWQEHGSDWSRDADGVVIDLHRELPGVGVDAEAAWQALWSTSEKIDIARYPVSTLALPVRALHVVLHAAHHGTDWGKALLHLERALVVADDSLWREAAGLATRLEASEAFAAGLRLTRAGTEIAEALGLAPGQSVEVALRASSPPPVALGFAQLESAAGFRARVWIVWRKFFPPAEFVRHWSPAARENRRALLWAYLRRPFWLARHAPAGFRAWRRTRRELRAR